MANLLECWAMQRSPPCMVLTVRRDGSKTSLTRRESAQARNKPSRRRRVGRRQPRPSRTEYRPLQVCERIRRDRNTNLIYRGVLTWQVDEWKTHEISLSNACSVAGSDKML